MWHSGALSATFSAKRPGGCVFCARFNAGLWNMLYRASPRTLGAYFTWLALFILQRARNDLKNVLGLVRRLFSRYLNLINKSDSVLKRFWGGVTFINEGQLELFFGGVTFINGAHLQRFFGGVTIIGKVHREEPHSNIVCRWCSEHRQSTQLQTSDHQGYTAINSLPPELTPP